MMEDLFMSKVQKELHETMGIYVKSFNGLDLKKNNPKSQLNPNQKTEFQIETLPIKQPRQKL